MDLSSNMVTIAMQRRLNESAEEAEATSGNLLNQLSFEISDINHRDYEATSFDCIHSRETLLHLKDKPKILQKFQVNKKDVSSQKLVVIICIEGTQKIFICCQTVGDRFARWIIWKKQLFRLL